MSDTSLTLYYADWCSHCQKFKPTWDALKGFLGQSGIQVAEYEHSSAKQKMEDEHIRAFPTLRVTKNGQTYDYRGDMSADSIINEVAPQFQTGGGHIQTGGEAFRTYLKYLKYKRKYRSLKW